MSNNKDHLKWMYDRLVERYGEDEKVDFMRRFKEIIDEAEKQSSIPDLPSEKKDRLAPASPHEYQELKHIRTRLLRTNEIPSEYMSDIERVLDLADYYRFDIEWNTHRNERTLEK